MPARRGDIAAHRLEVEQRTAAGASCEQIAEELRANHGLEISAKTVSRHRVAWGLRQRKAGTGRKFPDRKKVNKGRTKTQQQDARKAEITARTHAGETAEQIAAALQASGISLSKGVSTVWRLQTLWRLIPYDEKRARGKYSEAEKAKKAAARTQAQNQEQQLPKKRGPRKKEIAAPSNPAEIQHYPSDCSFGPQRRAPVLAPALRPESAPDDGLINIDPIDVNMTSDAHATPVGQYQQYATSAAAAAAAPTSVDLAAELMSADFLVDLASSTLAAAHNVKQLYLAQQALRPAEGLTTAIPTADDIVAAKRKVQEAAAVMHDLANPDVVKT